MADVLEILMLVCFGASWPLNILKSWRARTAKGKSILFNILIFGAMFLEWHPNLLCFPMEMP
ncbi:MAG: hypothetical protein SPI15_01255 [Candidatus Faecousia sp.]|nr:hypothetical protein [Clostridiales bacterium]MDY6179453.1 hypothetical protein [Candidatus Faecousia sp.]